MGPLKSVRSPVRGRVSPSRRRASPSRSPSRGLSPRSGTRSPARPPEPLSALRRVQVYTDPLQHAAIAAAVAAPLVPRAGRGVLATAVAAALAIDVDHVVAARSPRVRRTIALAARPRTHSAVTAVGAGALVAAAAGPVHGWAAFAALASHLLHDAGDHGAPTPVWWPFAPARQLGRRPQLVGTAALVLGSAAISRAMAAPGRGGGFGFAGGGGGSARPRTTGGPTAPRGPPPRLPRKATPPA